MIPYSMAKRARLRVRWFLSFIGVTALPFVIATLILVRGEQIIRHETDRVHLSQLSVFVHGLDSILKEVRTLEIAMIRDPDLRDLVEGRLDQSEEFLAARRLLSRYDAQSVDARTSVEWMVYFWETNRVLAQRAYTQDQNFLDHMLVDQPTWTLGSWRWQMRRLADQRFTLVSPLGWRTGPNEPVLLYSRLLPSRRPTEARAVVAFSVSSPLIRELLRSMITGPADAVVIYDGTSTIVLGQGDGQEIRDLIHSQPYTESPRTLRGTNFTVYRDQSANMPVEVLYKVGERGAFSGLRAHRTVSLAALLLSLFFAIALSAYLVSKNYSPVRRLLQLIIDTKGSTNRLTSDEFRVIESALTRALAETGELRALVHGQERSLELYRFRNLLKGITSDSDGDATNLFRINEVESYAIVLIDPVRPLDLNQVDEALTRTVRMPFRIVDRVVFETGVCVVTGAAGTMDPDSFLSQMSDLLHAVQISVGLDTAIGVSSCQPIHYSIRSAVLDAQTSLAYRIVEGTRNVLKPHHATMSRETFEFTLQQESELTNTIVAGDFAEARVITIDIIERNFEQKSLSIEMGRCLAFSLATMIIRSLNRVARYRENHIWDELRPINQIASCVTYEQLRTTILELLRVVCADIERNRQSHSTVLVTQIVEFIESGLNEPNLGTKSIAEHFDMNPAYIARVFKEHVGVSFGAYINRRRVEISKEMLSNTDRTISDIGQEIGYPESSSFIRFFRKFEGVTPGQYRDAVFIERS